MQSNTSSAPYRGRGARFCRKAAKLFLPGTPWVRVPGWRRLGISGGAAPARGEVSGSQRVISSQTETENVVIWGIVCCRHLHKLWTWQGHRIPEWFGWEGTLKSLGATSGQGHLSLSQVLQPGFGHFQGSTAPLGIPSHPHASQFKFSPRYFPVLNNK